MENRILPCAFRAVKKISGTALRLSLNIDCYLSECYLGTSIMVLPLCSMATHLSGPNCAQVFFPSVHVLTIFTFSPFTRPATVSEEVL